MDMTSNSIWHGMKISLENGNSIHIAYDYPKSIETFFNQWLSGTDMKEEWSFLEYLNNQWQGKYIAITMDHFEFLNTDASLLKKDKWSPAYFEISDGNTIDIMHNIPGPNKEALIKEAIEQWILRTDHHTESSFIAHFNKNSGFKAVQAILFNQMN